MDELQSKETSSKEKEKILETLQRVREQQLSHEEKLRANGNYQKFSTDAAQQGKCLRKGIFHLFE